jgi:hypothetical protein
MILKFLVEGLIVSTREVQIEVAGTESPNWEWKHNFNFWEGR